MSATLTAPTAPSADPRPLEWTWDEYMRAAEAGLFDGKRVMLIDGEVLVMSPMNDPHAFGITLALDAAQRAFGPGHTYRCQLPMRLLGKHDPEPDLVVLSGPARSNPTHPLTALLVVEVADTSLAYDLGVKASLYAAAGIADYWVTDVAGKRVVVFRDPRPDPKARFGYSYAQRKTHGPADSIAPLAAPHAVVAVADLLP